ncbi:MAG: hypothetical protein AAF721_07045 [Myxococcota bacterium]
MIIPLRDQEKRVASIVRGASDIADQEIASEPGGEPTGPLGLEILALDERSGDNTLAVLSLLHGQLGNLRTLQDLDPGTSIRRAASVARGRVWLILDSTVDPRLAAWGLGQVLRGQRAAIVPGEILAVDRALGATVLQSRRGGLVSAQRAVQHYLRAQNTPPAWSPSSKRGAVDKARLYVRGRLGRLGMAWLDRP